MGAVQITCQGPTPLLPSPRGLGGGVGQSIPKSDIHKTNNSLPTGETTLASTLRFPAKCSSAKICGRFTCTTADIRDRIRIAQPPVDPLPSKLSTSTSFTSSASLQRLYTLRRSWNFSPHPPLPGIVLQTGGINTGGSYHNRGCYV